MVLKVDHHLVVGGIRTTVLRLDVERITNLIDHCIRSRLMDSIQSSSNLLETVVGGVVHFVLVGFQGDGVEMPTRLEIIQRLAVDGDTREVGAVALLRVHGQGVDLEDRCIFFAMYCKYSRVAVQLAGVYLNCLSLMTCYIGDRRHLGVLAFDCLHRQGYRIVELQGIKVRHHRSIQHQSCQIRTTALRAGHFDFIGSICIPISSCHHGRIGNDAILLRKGSDECLTFLTYRFYKQSSIRENLILIFGYIEFLVVETIKFDIRQGCIIRQGGRIRPSVGSTALRTRCCPLHLCGVLQEDNRIRSYGASERHVGLGLGGLFLQVGTTDAVVLDIISVIERTENTRTRHHRCLRLNGISTYCAVLRRHRNHPIDERNRLQIGFLDKGNQRELLFLYHIFTGLCVEGHAFRNDVCERRVIAAVGHELHGINHSLSLLRRDGDCHRGVRLVKGGGHRLPRRSRHRNQVMQVTTSRRYMNGVRRGSRIKSRDREAIFVKTCQLIEGIQRTLDGQSVIAVVSAVLSPVTDVCGAGLEVRIESSVFPNYILCLVTHLTGEGEDRFLDIL